MNMNFIDNYELIDGKAIIDNNFSIVTANEALYRFMGISTLYTIIDIIHQVDLDDFINVANTLRPNAEKTMVIRMKRFDNSYRWMLAKVKRCISNFDDNLIKEYIELQVSDILVIDKQKNNYSELLLKSNHIMAIQGNIYFSYACKNNIISFYSYVDNKIVQMSECPLSAWINNLIQNDSIDADDYNELLLLQSDFLNCKNEFSYYISSNYFSFTNEYEKLAIKASTIFDKMKPVYIVGSIQNNENNGVGYSRYTYSHTREHELFTYSEVNKYVDENILFNSKCQFSLILMKIDNIDKMNETKGEDFVNELYSSIINTTKEKVGYRGVVGSYEFGTIYIAIKNIVTDINIRAFIESLRNQMLWNYKLLNQTIDITFSIGISRRPINGTDRDLLFKKALRALHIASEKGTNRFILYLDNVYGDIE